MGALPVFRRYGIHATFYVPSGLVCQPASHASCAHSPYLTLGDLRQIAADGNEIGGLSVQHVPLIGLPTAEAQREICDNRATLTRWGFRVTDFAYPFAQVNHALQILTQRCGYNSGLGAGQLQGAGLCPQCAWAETIPPRNPYLLRAPIEVSSVRTSWSPATFEDIVTSAQSHGGGWIIFNIHDVCAQACPLGVTLPELTSVLAWLSRQAGHGVSVRSVGQVIGGPVRPVVAGPRPPQIRGSGITNSRLSAVTTSGIPACFQIGRYGTNRASFRYAPDAGPGGAGAEVISLTQRRSGTAQLMPTPDLGACAPPVSAGRSYTLSAWYKSGQQVVFNAYYRTPAGTWVFWVTSPPMAASQRWTKATWNTPAVPAGASAISFGLALKSDGTLATTLYRLAPVRYSNTLSVPVRRSNAAAIAIGIGIALAAIAVAAVAVRRFRHSAGLLAFPFVLQERHQRLHCRPVASGTCVHRRSQLSATVELASEHARSKAPGSPQVQRAADDACIVPAPLLPRAVHRCRHCSDPIGTRSLPEEDSVQGSRIDDLPERVGTHHTVQLRARQNHNGRPHPDLCSNRGLQRFCQSGVVIGTAGGGEHDVPALDVRRHLTVSETGNNVAEIGHRDLVAAKDVDPSEQRHVGSHMCIIPLLHRIAPRPLMAPPRPVLSATPLRAASVGTATLPSWAS